MDGLQYEYDSRSIFDLQMTLGAPSQQNESCVISVSVLQCVQMIIFEQ